MSGRRKHAQRAFGCPLDGGVRRRHTTPAMSRVRVPCPTTLGAVVFPPRGTTATLQEWHMSNKELCLRFNAAWESFDVDAILAFFAEDATFHMMPTRKA